MKSKGHATLVGAFVVGAFAILVGFVVFTGGMTALRDQNTLTNDKDSSNIYGVQDRRGLNESSRNYRNNNRNNRKGYDQAGNQEQANHQGRMIPAKIIAKVLELYMKTPVKG